MDSSGGYKDGRRNGSQSYNERARERPRQPNGDRSGYGSYGSYERRNDRKRTYDDEGYDDRKRTYDNRGYDRGYDQGYGTGYDNRSYEYSNYEDRRYDDRRYNDYSSRSNGARYNNQRDSLHYRPNRTNGRPREVHEPQNSEMPQEPKSDEPQIPDEELLKKYEEQLESLKDVAALEELTGIDSQWGIKPKGFENVTAQRAKMSGLFPLPGVPRPVDFTKLEGIMKDGISDANNLLLESSKIEPIDSRVAKIVIVKNMDFDKVDHLKVCDYLNKFLSRLDVSGVQEQNIETKNKTRDDKNLIIEFKNNICATVVMTLNEKAIPLRDISWNTDEQADIVLELARPGEYVAWNIGKLADRGITNEIIDNALQVTLKVGTEFEEADLLEKIQDVNKVLSITLLRNKSTKESIGVAFVNFDLESYKTVDAIKNIKTILQTLKAKYPDVIREANFSCIIPDKTSIQECESDIESLKKLVRNEGVASNRKASVIQLINAITAADLSNDENYNFICQDIEQEANKYGKVKRIKIPRPANDFTPGLNQFSEPGLGKVFIEFEEEDQAFAAIVALAGRLYNDRTILCSYYDAGDFRLGLL